MDAALTFGDRKEGERRYSLRKVNNPMGRGGNKP